MYHSNTLKKQVALKMIQFFLRSLKTLHIIWYETQILNLKENNCPEIADSFLGKNPHTSSQDLREREKKSLENN